jgi:hypothetical protein
MDNLRKTAGVAGKIAISAAALLIGAEFYEAFQWEIRYAYPTRMEASIRIAVWFAPYVAILLLYAIDFCRAAFALGLCVGGFYAAMYLILLTQSDPKDPLVLFLFLAVTHLLLGTSSLWAYRRLPQRRWVLLLCGALPTAVQFLFAK